jgi:type VI secretion system protein ImpL
MTGRMVGAGAQFEDTGDWIGFLQVLLKQRPERPLNGVIVSVPIDQLADRPDAQIEKLASSIRERVQEVIQTLGVVFPVYVTFTKCDLVAGFAEFFSDLGAAERQQPWGATISVDRSESEAAEVLFDGEFALLQAALADRRMTRLSEIPDPLQRARAFTFPAQMERVRPALRRFMRTLFSEDATVKDQPLFRGFYFAAGDVQGTPVDRVLEPAARALGMTLGEAAPPQTPPGAWFVHELLTGVVFEDAALAGVSAEKRARDKMRRLILLGVLGVIFLAFVILFSSLSCANGRLIGATKTTARAAVTHVRPDGSLLDNLESLEDLRKNVAIVDSLKHYGPPWWRWLGAWSGSPVRDPALEVYTTKALDALIGPSYDGMQAQLDTLTSHFSGEPAEFYYTFRSWRLLATPRDLTREDAPLVTRVVNRLQADRVRSLGQDVRDHISELVEAQVTFLCTHPEFLEKRFFPTPSPALVARAHQVLHDTWDPASFYRIMIGQVGRYTQPVGVAMLTGNSRLLSGTAEVKGPYTRDGWEKQVKPRIEWWRAQVARDGDLRDAFAGRTPDLAGSLLNTYADDYTQQWIGLLKGTKAADFSGSRAAGAENMRLLAADDSPLMALLAGASEQLTFSEPTGSPMERVESGFAMLHDFARAPAGGSWGRAVAGAATKFGKAITGKKNDAMDRGGLPSTAYLEQIRGAQKVITEKAQPGVPELEFLGLFSGGSSAVQAALAWIDQKAAGYMAGPARDASACALKLPIRMFTGEVCGSVVEQKGVWPRDLAANWTELVLKPYQRTLMGKYPCIAGGPDASMADFIEFFRPGGTFWSFYDANLKSLLLEDGQQAGAIRPPQDLADCVRHAHEIREAFFAANPTQPSVSLAVRTTTADVEGPQVFVRKIHLDVGGGFLTYTNGVRQWDNLQWPGADPAVGAVLRAELSFGVTAESKAFPGPWGFFHLLDQATWSGTGDAPKVVWRLNAGQSRIVVEYELQPKTASHPFRPDFMRFTVPSP